MTCYFDLLTQNQFYLFASSSLFSLRKDEVSIARLTTTKSCSMLKGFSIKS